MRKNFFHNLFINANYCLQLVSKHSLYKGKFLDSKHLLSVPSMYLRKSDLLLNQQLRQLSTCLNTAATLQIKSSNASCCGDLKNLEPMKLRLQQLLKSCHQRRNNLSTNGKPRTLEITAPTKNFADSWASNLPRRSAQPKPARLPHCPLNLKLKCSTSWNKVSSGPEK